MSKCIKVIERTRIRLPISASGELHNEESESCLSCTQNAYWSSSIFLPNIIKLSQTVWELWPAQCFDFSGDNYITKIVKVNSLARDTPTGPPLHSYQILSKYM